MTQYPYFWVSGKQGAVQTSESTDLYEHEAKLTFHAKTEEEKGCSEDL